MADHSSHVSWFIGAATSAAGVLMLLAANRRRLQLGIAIGTLVLMAGGWALDSVERWPLGEDTTQMFVAAVVIGTWALHMVWLHRRVGAMERAYHATAPTEAKTALGAPQASRPSGMARDVISWMEPNATHRRGRGILNIYCQLICADARRVEAVKRFVPNVAVEFAGKQIVLLAFGEFVPKEKPNRLLYGGEMINEPENSDVPLDGKISVRFVIPDASSAALNAAGLSHRKVLETSLTIAQAE